MSNMSDTRISIENKDLTNLMYCLHYPAERLDLLFGKTRDIALRFPAPGPCVILPKLPPGKHKLINSSSIWKSALSTFVIWRYTYSYQQGKTRSEHKYYIVISI